MINKYRLNKVELLLFALISFLVYRYLQTNARETRRLKRIINKHPIAISYREIPITIFQKRKMEEAIHEYLKSCEKDEDEDIQILNLDSMKGGL